MKRCKCGHLRQNHYLAAHQCMAAMCACDDYEAPEEGS